MSARESFDSFKTKDTSKSLRDSAARHLAGIISSANTDVPIVSPAVIDRSPNRQLLGTFVAVVVLLFAIAGLSAAPLSASKEGWLHFYQEDMETTYLRNLNLEPWDHFISVGYYKQTNAIRQYAAANDWVLAGQRMHRYTKLWTNLRYGDAAQLVGGYAAGMLALSCLTAVVCLGLLARCAVAVWRQRGMGGPPACESGQASISADRRLHRPLGPWLWPIALINMVLVAALMVTFFLVMNASNSYQTSRLVPGTDCPLKPDWGWWTGLSASFGWLAVLLLAATETRRQYKAEEH